MKALKAEAPPSGRPAALDRLVPMVLGHLQATPSVRVELVEGARLRLRTRPVPARDLAVAVVDRLLDERIR